MAMPPSSARIAAMTVAASSSTKVPSRMARNCSSVCFPPRLRMDVTTLLSIDVLDGRLGRGAVRETYKRPAGVGLKPTVATRPSAAIIAL
jgi:hypothetical protein